jgi:hypothetical protein
VNRQAIETAMNRLWLLWAALLASLVIYLVIAERVTPAARPLDGVPVSMRASLLLYLVALAVFACAFGLRRLLLRPTGPSIVPAADGPRALARYTAAVLVSSALCESVAVMALVLHLVGYNRETVYSLILLSAGAMLVLRPRNTELERLLNRLH